MLNVILVAGGLGTRFQKLSVFPKILLPLAEESSILTSHLNNPAYKKAKFYLVINTKFADQVRNYLEVNEITNVTVLTTSNCNGSYNSLYDVKDQLPEENLLFIWSDLFVTNPKSVVNECELCNSHGLVFTIHGSYRYKVNSVGGEITTIDELKKDSNELGNVPGIYYLKDKTLFHKVRNNESNKNFDLIDAVSEYIKDGATFNEVDLHGITEYKDLPTYICLIKSKAMKIRCKNKTRFFNKLTLSKDQTRLTKTAIISDYYPIIQKERDWYKKYEEIDPSQNKPIPKIYWSDDPKDSVSIEMEYLNGYVPLHDLLDELESDKNFEAINEVYNKIYDAVFNLHHSSAIQVPVEQFEEDLRKELVTKIIDRCKKIRPMLVNFPINDFELEKVYQEVLKMALKSPDYNPETKTMTYYFSHGDLNGSNIMVNKSDYSIKFIDPRGYFGNTLHYGWREYDYAKLLYCLYGYDDFNNLPQIYGYDIPQIRETFANLKTRPGFLNRPLYKILVGIIYVGLAGYISQDILKANIAADYGSYLLRLYCSKAFELKADVPMV